MMVQRVQHRVEVRKVTYLGRRSRPQTKLYRR